MNTENWNVLLVDDEQEFVSTLAERLELRGITPRVVNDGQSALQEIAREEPQVVVLDVMMPGLKGLDVLERIKTEYPKVRVILLTGQGKTRDGIQGMQRGAFGYLNKPLDLEELLQTMTEAINAR